MTAIGCQNLPLGIGHIEIIPDLGIFIKGLLFHCKELECANLQRPFIQLQLLRRKFSSA